MYDIALISCYRDMQNRKRREYIGMQDSYIRSSSQSLSVCEVKEQLFGQCIKDFVTFQYVFNHLNIETSYAYSLPLSPPRFST